MKDFITKTFDQNELEVPHNLLLVFRPMNLMSSASAIVVPAVPVVSIDTPKHFYTLHSDALGGPKNPRSAQVIKKMEMVLSMSGSFALAQVFATREEAEAAGVCGDTSVALYDAVYKGGEYSPVLTRLMPDAPDWSRSTRWAVIVKPKCAERDSRLERCANQVAVMFSDRIFRQRVDNEQVPQFPWGSPPNGMSGLKEIVNIDSNVARAVFDRLNSGPDLAKAIADRKFAAELPEGSKISWVRLLPSPLGYSRTVMHAVTIAFRRFEQACQTVLTQDPEIRATILSGLVLKDPRLANVYLNPGVPCFSVARPDLHWTKDGVCASENDEMPGGMPELALLDLAYGINADAWKAFYDWLTSSGPLVFLVSHEWSKCYIPEVTWLVEHIQKLGYDARLLTTDRLDELQLTADGVYHNGDRVGTIWRQFPIFETVGKLADLVLLARDGIVRMYPEWAHFGNKAWFHLFWKHQDRYAKLLSESDLSLLRGTIPESHFVNGAQSFPFTVNGILIESPHKLASLPETERDQLVLKVCGANDQAARSYGVLMGKGIKSSDWSEWVLSRVRDGEPFLVQKMFNTGVVQVPVWHTKQSIGQLFRCKILMRPWVVNGNVLSIHACMVPHTVHKVHGMVSMAVGPVQLIEDTN